MNSKATSGSKGISSWLPTLKMVNIIDGCCLAWATMVQLIENLPSLSLQG